MANLILHKGFMLQGANDNPDPWLEDMHSGEADYHEGSNYWRRIAGQAPQVSVGGATTHGEVINRYVTVFSRRLHSASRTGITPDSPEGLRQRLANANDLFRRKAA